MYQLYLIHCDCTVRVCWNLDKQATALCRRSLEDEDMTEEEIKV